MSQLSPSLPARPFEPVPIAAGMAGQSDIRALGDTVEAEVNHIVPGAAKPAVHVVPPGEGVPRREAVRASTDTG